MTERLDLPTLINRYHDEDACRDLLEALRWPDGVECPKCQERERLSRVAKRDTWRCNACAYHFSVRAGTVLQDSKLPLWKWFLATYLVCESKKGYSSNQLKRTLGVTYKTAWFLTHRIRGAMGQVHREQLTGVVEVDETFHGGKRRFPGRPGFTGPQPGYNVLADKTIVVGAVQRGGEVRLRVVPDRRGKTLGAFITTEVADGASAVYTDEFAGYRSARIADRDTIHETVNHNADEWVRGDVHTNTVEGVWSLFKRSVIGTHHHMSVKHLPAYLDEIAFKYNNRDNEHIFRETLRVLVTADPMTYAELTADD